MPAHDHRGSSTRTDQKVKPPLSRSAIVCFNLFPTTITPLLLRSPPPASWGYKLGARKSLSTLPPPHSPPILPPNITHPLYYHYLASPPPLSPPPKESLLLRVVVSSLCPHVRSALERTAKLGEDVVVLLPACIPDAPRYKTPLVYHIYYEYFPCCFRREQSASYISGGGVHPHPITPPLP